MSKGNSRTVPLFSPEFIEVTKRLSKDKKGTKAMPDKVIEKMAESTRQVRLDMHALMIDRGLSEDEALRRVLPDDRNRTKKLRRWKEHGLWPQVEGTAEGRGPGEVETDNEPQNEKGLQTEVNTVKPCIDTEAELLEKVRVLLNTIEPVERPVGATAKGRYSPLKTELIAIRLPVALHEELKALKGAKPKSWHIERALMLYLKVMKGTQDGKES